MEWMLQVIDELDDAIGALRLWGCGAGAEMGLVVGCSIGVLAIGAALLMGAEPRLMSAAAIVLAAAAALRIRGLKFAPGR